MAEKLKVGIVGMGTIGGNHAKALQNVPAAQLAALCDIKPDVLERRGAEFGVARLFSDYRKMVRESDLDVVYVCTPNYLHCPVTVAAFQAGKHVFCEKPMAMSAAEGRKMVAARDAAKRLLQMGMVWRQNADSRTLKSYIEAGRLGAIYHMRIVLRRRRGIPSLGNWFTTKAQAGGGAMIDIGVHFLDLVMWLSDSWRPERVSAQTWGKFGSPMEKYTYIGMWAGPPNFQGVFDVDDYGAGLVRFASGRTLSFEISWAQNAPEQNFVEILGDKGGAHFAGGTPLTLYTEDNGKIVDIMPKSAEVKGFEAQSAKFMDAIRGQGSVAATGEEGVVVMKVLDAVYKSSTLGKEVVVPRD